MTIPGAVVEEPNEPSMIVPRILGFIAPASLIAASMLGRRALRADTGCAKQLAHCSSVRTISRFWCVVFPFGDKLPK